MLTTGRSRARSRARSDLQRWNPLRLQGCVAWLDARAIPAGAVASTPNLGTLGGSFTQGTGTRQPTLGATSGPGSQPGLSFDGGDFIASDLAASSWTSLHQTACAVYVVSRMSSIANAYYGLLNTGRPDARGITVYVENRAAIPRTNALGAYVHNGTGVVAFTLVDNTYTVGSWQVSEVLWEYGASGDDLRVLRDGTSVATAESALVPSASAPTYSLQIGAYGAGPASGFSGVVAEVIVYNRALSDAERAAVRRYLGGKHGITVA